MHMPRRPQQEIIDDEFSEDVSLEDDELDGEVDDESLNDEEISEENVDGSAENIDDQVRLYLSQMGEIPLLTRAEELNAAERIEAARAAYELHIFS